MIAGMFDSGAMPALERTVQFTGQRHRVLAHNIANLSTPNYRPTDLDPAQFQSSLRDAIERRREDAGPGPSKPLEMQDTRQLKFHDSGIEAKPEPADRNILFHDRNNRDLDRTMQDLAENTLMHEIAIELLSNQFDMLRMAIREQP